MVVPTRGSVRSPDIVAVGAWVAVVAVAMVWGVALLVAGHRIFLPSPPLFGWVRLPTPRLAYLPPVVVGVVSLWIGPQLVQRLSWRRLLWVAAAASAVWGVALASTEGLHAIARPLTLRYEYLNDVWRVQSPLDYVSHFLERLPDFANHVRVHPPGMVLLLWSIARLGLKGPGWAAVFVITVGSTTAPGALVAVKELAGEDAARRATPFLALAPTALWMVTSADAVFAAVTTWAVAFFVLSVRESPPARAPTVWLCAMASGLLLGAAAFLSYGAVLVGLVLVVVAWARRAFRQLAVTSLVVAAVVGAFAASGFWWLAGLRAAHVWQYRGVVSSRPYGYFLVADLAAFAVAVGPAVAAGVARLRDRGAWLLVGPTLLTLAVVDLSAFSKGEVERIWLPFAPWVLVATIALPKAIKPQRAWLGAQLALAFGLQIAVHLPW